MHSRIVGDAYYEACVDAGVGHRVERIRGYIEPYVLHSRKGALSGKAGAECRFKGYLFVRCPFAVDIIILYSFFCDLRARSTRIA